MGIDGVIIIERTGRPIIQTTFKTGGSAVAAQHVDALNNAYETAAAEGKMVDPVVVVETSLGTSACCNVQHGSLRIACPVHSETDPLFVFSFIKTLIDVLQDYLGEVSAGSIRQNFDIVYQLLEEMLDDGYPLTTEPNALRDIVIPPSFFKKILAVAGTAGLAKATTTPFSSPIPWRATGLRYNTNEIFFDFVEDMTGVISREGKPLNLEVWGKVKTNARLTGTPDILLSLSNTQILTDCSFHPCVRLPKWAKDKTLSFVPPDGRFILMEYRMATTGTSTALVAPVPFNLTAAIDLLDESANVDLAFQLRLGSSKGIENIVVEWDIGHGVTSSSWIPTNGGSYTFDARSGILQWQVPATVGTALCNLRGTFNYSPSTLRPSPSMVVSFSRSDVCFSGIKIQDLRVSGEFYKPFRGVRSQSQCRLEVRDRKSVV